MKLKALPTWRRATSMGGDVEDWRGVLMGCEGDLLALRDILQAAAVGGHERPVSARSGAHCIARNHLLSSQAWRGHIQTGLV